VKFPDVDTKSATAVAAFVRQKFAACYAPGSGTSGWFDRVFDDVGALFAGRHPDYLAIDLRYHDLQHTFQAAVCLTVIFEQVQTSFCRLTLSPRQWELGIAAILLHDTGYLKLRGDTTGTGAKYTYCHVVRSCAFAASYLPTVGASPSEIDGVVAAISCTGPGKEVGRLHFNDPVERWIGHALATADYLGQMAAPDYPDELEFLYAEFAESDDFAHVPATQRAFSSVEALVMLTPGFWRKVVLPKLDSDFQGIYRYLATPYPAGRNAYIEAIERNIALIEERNLRRATA
jgi:hypothetical protein